MKDPLSTEQKSKRKHRKKLAKGDKVEMTPAARKMFPDAIHVGVVTHLLGGHSIRVRRMGLKTHETWHDDYWRPTRLIS